MSNDWSWRTWLFTISVGLAVTLGTLLFTDLWRLCKQRLGGTLVADLLETEQRLHPEVLQLLRQLDASSSNSTEKATTPWVSIEAMERLVGESLRKAISSSKKRALAAKAVAARLSFEQQERRSLKLLRLLTWRAKSSTVRVLVENTTSSVKKEVVLQTRRAGWVHISTNGRSRTIKFSGSIKLGDLRPGQELTAFLWSGPGEQLALLTPNTLLKGPAETYSLFLRWA